MLLASRGWNSKLHAGIGIFKSVRPRVCNRSGCFVYQYSLPVRFFYTVGVFLCKPCMHGIEKPLGVCHYEAFSLVHFYDQKLVSLQTFLLLLLPTVAPCAF